MIEQLTPPLLAFSFFLAGVTLDEKSLIPVGCASSVGLGIWWLGRKLQRIEDTQEFLREGQEGINQRINNLPCDAVCKEIRQRH